MAEEIDVRKKCNFRNFTSSVALTLTWIGSKSYWSRSTHTPNYIEIGKTFCGRTDVRTDTTDFSKSIRSSPRDDLKIERSYTTADRPLHKAIKSFFRILSAYYCYHKPDRSKYVTDKMTTSFFGGVHSLSPRTCTSLIFSGSDL